jgi:hypothetical protein
MRLMVWILRDINVNLIFDLKAHSGVIVYRILTLIGQNIDI